MATDFQTDYTQTDLKALMVEHFRTFMKGRKVGDKLIAPNVLPAYPMKPELLPCISVTYTSDTLAGKVQGLEYGREATEGGEVKEYKGTLFRTTVEVRYFAENGQLRDAARPYLRAGLFAALEPLDKLGMQLPQITGGADEQEFSQQAPQELYMVAYQLSLDAPLMATNVYYEKAEAVDVGIFAEPVGLHQGDEEGTQLGGTFARSVGYSIG